MIRAATEIRGRNLDDMCPKYCRRHLKDPGVNGRIILRRIFLKWDMKHDLDLTGSREGHMAALVNAVMYRGDPECSLGRGGNGTVDRKSMQLRCQTHTSMLLKGR